MTEFRNFNALNNETAELEGKLAESEANRDLKSNRINEEMRKNKLNNCRINSLEKANEIHLETIKRWSLHNVLEAKRLDKKEIYITRLVRRIDILEMANCLLRRKSKKTTDIVQKYVNFAGYKHLDINFTKVEKQILKKIESCK